MTTKTCPGSGGGRTDQGELSISGTGHHLTGNQKGTRQWGKVLAVLLFLLLLSGCRLSGEVAEIKVLGEQTKSTGIVMTTSAGTTSGGTAGADPAGTDSGGRATFIICEIKGHIKNPGVYDLAEGSRVSELILRSGGVLDSGSLEWVNQARKLKDGEVVVIPARGVSREEYQAMAVGNPDPGPVPGTVQTNGGGPRLVNINTATETELQTVPGIGPVTAKNIVDYRTFTGPFGTLEDLKKVDRIGEKTFEKLKAYLTVGP